MTPARVNECRGQLVWALRVASVVLIVAGACLILNRVVMAVVNLSPGLAFTSWEGIGATHPLYLGVALGLVGAALGWRSSAIARWAFPVMPSGCPRCGYERVESDRCPECGLGGFAPEP
jgi:hypothetical protein